MRATAIIPVKRFHAAKRRLLDAIDRRQRAALIKAMLSDVLTAADRAHQVERAILVSGEGRAEQIALHVAQRVNTPIEVLREPRDTGHAQAAVLGIVRSKALGAECVVLLPGDCPLLDAGELDDALERMAPGRVCVVPDRHGTGTNALLMAPADALGPAFGEGSRARHAERAGRLGLQVAVEPLDSLALDVDTPDDLRALGQLLDAEPARAPQTAQVLRRIEAEVGL